jgi:hypothetical protein
MPLKRNQACLVCGKDGTTKSVVSRVDLPLSDIVGKGRLTQTVTRSIGLQGKTTLFLENETGERKIDDKGKYRLREGDYIKVLLEDDKGDMNESICRLT